MSREKSETESRRGHLVGGIIVLGLGIFFLMVQMDWLPFIQHSWPVILIIVGIALLIGSLTKSRREKDSPE